MATDRFVRWEGGRRPTAEQLFQVLKDYIGSAGTVEWKEDRWYVSFPGPTSHPLKTLAPKPQFDSLQAERWIEVCLAPDNMDVITRGQDAFVRAVADGFADFCASLWDGRFER